LLESKGQQRQQIAELTADVREQRSENSVLANAIEVLEDALDDALEAESVGDTCDYETRRLADEVLSLHGFESGDSILVTKCDWGRSWAKFSGGGGGIQVDSNPDAASIERYCVKKQRISVAPQTHGPASNSGSCSDNGSLEEVARA